MPSHRQHQIRYRCPSSWGAPLPGTILMGTGPKVRRAYRVLGAVRAKGLPALGVATWRLQVEPMGVAAGRAEIEAGSLHWRIVWDKPEPKRHG